jgi:hypothetical protein
VTVNADQMPWVTTIGVPVVTDIWEPSARRHDSCGVTVTVGASPAVLRLPENVQACPGGDGHAARVAGAGRSSRPLVTVPGRVQRSDRGPRSHASAVEATASDGSTVNPAAE